MSVENWKVHDWTWEMHDEVRKVPVESSKVPLWNAKVPVKEIMTASLGGLSLSVLSSLKTRFYCSAIVQ